MPSNSFKTFIAVCGIIGTASLVIYFTAPFTFMPLPPPSATEEQIKMFGTNYRTAILFDTWLQQLGSFLSIVFTLGLIHIANASQTFAGKLTFLVSGVILVLSLAEGTFVLTAVYSGDNGHYGSSITCFDLTNTFIHIFLLAPSLFLMQGIALLPSKILPRTFIYLSIGLGIIFQVMGVAGLFYQPAILIVIFVLIAQNIWTIAASVTLLVRKP